MSKYSQIKLLGFILGVSPKLQMWLAGTMEKILNEFMYFPRVIHVLVIKEIKSDVKSASRFLKDVI